MIIIIKTRATLSFSLSSLSLSLKNKRERKLLASFFTRELISLSLSLSFSQDFSKLLFRVTNETLTTQFGFLHQKERKSPQNHITRIEELLKLLGKSSSWRRCSEEEEEKEEKGCFWVFFLIPSSLKLAFQEEAEAKEIIITPKFVFFCVLKIQNETKHSSRRRRETPRRSAVAVVAHRRRRKRRESSEREREKVDEALFDFKRSSSIECLV